MTINKILARLVLVAAGSLGVAGGAGAVAVNCSNNTTINYMQIDSSIVSACLGSGDGNISGNPGSDEFLSGATGAGYGLISKTDEANPYAIVTSYDEMTGLGSFGFNVSAWDAFASLAIGFKYGTGQNIDSWFVYSLVRPTGGGDFTFVNVCPMEGGCGSGLSHVNLYGIAGSNEVPEPAALGLLGLALGGLSIAWRRRKA
jgi:hypothetical protein